MAAPITHIVFANKVFDKYFSGKNKRAFFVGTSFPDIRYYDNLDREKTHFKTADIKEIVSENSFLAGLKLHSYLDDKREAFYSSLPGYPFYFEPRHVMDSALKFFEDEIFYERMNNWGEIVGFFDEALPEEKQLGPTEEDVEAWHKLLREYLSKKPNNLSRKGVLVDIGFHNNFAEQVNIFIKVMRQDEKIIAAVNGFCDKFEELIRS